MPIVKVYNQKGEVVGEEKLSDVVFGVKVKPGVVQQVVVAQQANRRTVLAHVKDRSEVRGGGRKPWKQKGTGRARQGSIRSPLWRGGGITFGPNNNRNFSMKINKKVNRQALLMVLSDKVADGKLIALDQLTLPEIKTKNLATILQNLQLRKKKNVVATKTAKAVKTKVADKNILLISDQSDQKIKMSARNLQKVTTINAGSINLLAVMKAQYLVASLAALKKIEALFGAKQ